VGVGLSFLVWQPLSVLTVFVTAAICAGVLFVLLSPTAGPHSPLAAVKWMRIVTRAAGIGAAVVAFSAFSVVLPYLALPLAGLAVLSSPWAVDRLRRWRADHPGTRRQAPTGRPLVHEAHGPTDPDAPGPAPLHGIWSGSAVCRLDVTESSAREMTNSELCREWRRSFVALQSAPSPGDLARVVAQRQVYLDELDRRSPSALQAWLASGARAAGGPERYLPGEPDDGRPDAA
jgi:hypothetical protein